MSAPAYYLDTSVLLRSILGDRGSLRLADLAPGITSALTEVESLRTLDRCRASGHLTAEEVSVLRDAVYRTLTAVELVELSPAVLHRAASPFPTPLGTLDALHLATALEWAERQADLRLTFATHDVALGRAARSCGLAVAGV